MRFIADENVEQPVIEFVRTAGHDVLAVSETLPGANDEKIVSLARSGSRIVLTNDKDFGELVYLEKKVPAGVVLLRSRLEDSAGKVALMKRWLPAIARHGTGYFAVVSERGCRFRSING